MPTARKGQVSIRFRQQGLRAIGNPEVPFIGERHEWTTQLQNMRTKVRPAKLLLVASLALLLSGCERDLYKQHVGQLVEVQFDNGSGTPGREFGCLLAVNREALKLRESGVDLVIPKGRVIHFWSDGQPCR